MLDKIKNLSMLQIFGIVAGGLILNKVLKTKIAIVGKTAEVPFAPVLSIVSVADSLSAEFSAPVVESTQPIVKNVMNEIVTPFNTPEVLYAGNVQKFTGDYFEN